MIGNFGKFLKVAAGAAAFALSAHVGAAVLVIDDTSGNNQTAVSGSMDYSVQYNGGDSYSFLFSLTNTSSLGGTGITGVAIDLLTGSTVLSGIAPTDWDFQAGGTLPGEALAFDACWYGGPNCGAGGTDRILEGQTLSGFSVTFTLAGYGGSAANVESALTSGFGDGSLRACVRVIGIPTTGPGSGNGAGSDVACSGGDDFFVPEPAMLGLLGLGLVGIAAARRRRAA